VLRAGLETADWVTVDDTSARHRGANAVCTQIGNDTFAWFGFAAWIGLSWLPWRWPTKLRALLGRWCLAGKSTAKSAAAALTCAG
jgi:hypothetical protein